MTVMRTVLRSGRPLRARLTGRAQRFLWLAQDFGHLDERRLEEVFVTLGELGGATEEPLDLPVVRRVVASIVFNGLGSGDPGEPDGLDPTSPLAEDWPLLFS